jgi:hypothetical protein
MGPVVGIGEATKAHSTASLEYIRVEENGQRNTACGQGNCISKHLQKFAEEGIIPSGAFEFSAQGAF